MNDPLPDALRDAIALFPARAASHLGGDVDVGDVAEVGAFEHDEARVGLALDDVALSGLDSLEPVRLDWGGGADATITFVTSSASLRGSYRVASSPVSHAALQLTTALGDTDALAAAAAEDDTNLARWFRDQELAGSNNGRVLNGMYMAHEATMNKLTTGKFKNSVPLRNELKKQRTKDTRNAARKSGGEHQLARMRGGSTDNVERVGDETQMSAGLTVQAYMLAAATEAAGPQAKDPRNEYAQLMNSTKWFACAVKWARKKQAGPATPQQLLNIIANAKREEIDADCGRLAKGVGAAEDAPYWPIDYEYYESVYNARAERRLKSMQPARGSFAAADVVVEIDVDVIIGDDGVSVDDVRPRIPLLRIRLDSAPMSERASLHERLDAFVSSTGFYIDLVRSRIAAALTAPSMRERFVRTLTD